MDTKRFSTPPTRAASSNNGGRAAKSRSDGTTSTTGDDHLLDFGPFFITTPKEHETLDQFLTRRAAKDAEQTAWMKKQSQRRCVKKARRPKPCEWYERLRKATLVEPHAAVVEDLAVKTAAGRVVTPPTVDEATAHQANFQGDIIKPAESSVVVEAVAIQTTANKTPAVQQQRTPSPDADPNSLQQLLKRRRESDLAWLKEVEERKRKRAQMEDDEGMLDEEMLDEEMLDEGMLDEEMLDEESP
ncbi:hypothetical protein B0T21DRAFT_411461 [Apiosordaria backusii]|uniref:Uncharacterized protein n=1 Tax=Apiosordaria backusii TaxID=314023 RepID=A0AA40BL75_9PEZI|nr:hypothetical protein B0T21DRAFT_411461 [Apiosordaria backusii]